MMKNTGANKTQKNETHIAVAVAMQILRSNSENKKPTAKTTETLSISSPVTPWLGNGGPKNPIWAPNPEEEKAPNSACRSLLPW